MLARCAMNNDAMMVLDTLSVGDVSLRNVLILMFDVVYSKGSMCRVR